MRYTYIIVLAMLVLVSLSGAETVRYFDYETEEEITQEETGNRSHIIVTYDERGENPTVNYFDSNGKLTDVVGYFGKEVLYNESGDEIGYRAFNIVPGEITSDGKIHFRISDFDFDGKLTKVSNTDVKGDLIFDKSGTCERRISYTENGDETAQRFFGINGEPILGPGGFHRIEIEYNDNGKTVSIAGYDVSGGPVQIGLDYCQKVYEYDTYGNIITISYFAPVGKPAASHFVPGVHRIEFTYLEINDGRFEKISESAFGLDNKPTIKNDWHINFPGFFEFSRGDVFRNYIKGVHRIEKELFENGKDKSVSFFGVDDELTTDHHNVHRYEFEWNKNRDLAAITAINSDGVLINGFFPGYVRLEYVFDDEGWPEVKALYGKNGEPIATKDGVHKVTYEKRDDGLYNHQSFNINGEPVDKDMSFFNYESSQGNSQWKN